MTAQILKIFLKDRKERNIQDNVDLMMYWSDLFPSSSEFKWAWQLDKLLEEAKQNV